MLHGVDRRAFAVRPPPTWLAPAIDYIDTHYTGAINVRALAAKAGVHPVHFARVFRQAKHCTVAQYVYTLRVGYACSTLLRIRDLPLVQIAMDMGFSDQAHFTRIFTGMMGYSPGAFRRSMCPDIGCPRAEAVDECLSLTASGE